MRIAVLGLGGVGTAAARFLARDGHQVIGFEQFQLDHDRGSSYGASRIIRKVYPDPFYAELMEGAYPLWAELEREAGEELLLRCGGFFFGPESHPDMAGTEAALTEVGVPYECLSRGEAARRFPQFQLAAGEYGVWDPESGLLRASRCVLANAAGARAAGAELRCGARVEALDSGPEGVDLRVDGRVERFDRVVLTAGPWTRELLAPYAQLPLTVTRQQYAHFGVKEPGSFSPERFPVWIDFAQLFYGFPEHDGIPGAKAALHVPGPAVDPAHPDRTPDPLEDEKLRCYVSGRLPGLTGDATLSKVCLYTMTPDEDFVLDYVPGHPRLVVVGGLSGHGFKFTVLLGLVAARLALEQRPGFDLGRFRLSRFTKAQPPGAEVCQ